MTRDLVVYSLEAWDEIWRRNQFLIAGLLQSDPDLRVLFVEPPTDPLYDLSRRDLPRPPRGLREVTLPGVAPGRLHSFEPTKWFPRSVGDPDRLINRAVLRAARKLDMRRPVLWINDPAGAALLDAVDWPALYDITDDWLVAKRSSRQHDQVAHNERRLMERCAEVVVCSVGLAETKGRQRPVVLVPNAVDVDRFRRPMPRPSGLPPGPYAAYVGTVHSDRFDVDLAVATAEVSRTAGGRLALVGPMLLGHTEQQRLTDAGAVILGARPYPEVPGYLQHAAVLVVPHIVDDFTMSLDPIKLYEYRSVGRPVVSTPVAGFRDSDDPAIRIADRDFPTTVAELIRAAGSPEFHDHLYDLAEDIPTWSERVRQMHDVLDRVAVVANTSALPAQ